MSKEDQEVIAQAEVANDFTGDAYQRVNTRFMELHAAAAPGENALNIYGARKTLANWPIKRPGDPMSLRRPAISRIMTIPPSCAVYTCQR